MRLYWEKELARFERPLQHFPEQLKQMWLTLRRVRRPERFEAVRAALRREISSSGHSNLRPVNS
jgi:hypothetical protein